MVIHQPPASLPSTTRPLIPLDAAVATAKRSTVIFLLPQHTFLALHMPYLRCCPQDKQQREVQVLHICLRLWGSEACLEHLQVLAPDSCDACKVEIPEKDKGGYKNELKGNISPMALRPAAAILKQIQKAKRGSTEVGHS